ncbi:hypothetical protein [Mesorhizobium sp. M7A.F.Ca.US.008.03.1.1]|uniref:hypothetical protein n=1 Tax=Mesorhizobium sp. M7A.F.Ca.US.008.03.1.1 TaxID=2496742 RepID=UPI000FCB8AF0|nr:hypothetical protein [Mesorhizobium sp. M7A.F.Ca.US.008.03.1.1]RUW61137.1 hypothetical protein EOA16_15245 [Mesorhizobium sp. M7A.F.Ca.US.008.03.1.1]
MTYQFKELLAGRLTREFCSEEPTARRAVEKATGNILAALHRSGKFFVEVTDISSGRTYVYEYADDVVSAPAALGPHMK